MKRMNIQAKDREFYSYDACGKDVLNASGSTVECPRVVDHEGSCRPTIPFADFKAIAMAKTTGRKK